MSPRAERYRNEVPAVAISVRRFIAAQAHLVLRGVEPSLVGACGVLGANPFYSGSSRPVFTLTNRSW